MEELHPTFFLENLGCAKNQVDAEIMISRLEDRGWRLTDQAGDAQYILINTCGFIQPAKEESIEVTMEYLRDYPESKVILTGCLAQRYPEDLSQDIPEVEGVFGNHSVQRIAEFLEDRLPRGQRVFIPGASYGPNPELPAPEFDSRHRTRLLSYPGSAYLKISEGCRNRCSFCAIPLIRGSLRSRTIQDVTQEARGLLSRGIKELNLIAQDLSDFGRDRGPAGRGEFPALVKSLLELPGDFWIRLLYIYPEHFPLEILEICNQDPRVLPYFDIPMQHASSKILKAMGRPGTKESNLELIQRIRERLPQAVIRTSIITGFPGEDQDDLGELMDFQDRARIEWLGVFAYSREEGTRAAAMGNQIPPEEALRRKHLLEDRQIPIMHSRIDRFIGSPSSMIIEDLVPQRDGQAAAALGRTPFQAPDVDGLTVLPAPPGHLKPGMVVPVTIKKRNGVDLIAQAL
ncbi:30S ribosomal protein S12 methylthiotransferase RimO [Spirochaeta lutea]|uniref:Ribosomal protein uS12 methylthiotransferase RimO n=1 Tax=Spirochaeta lutea TaxID=1480694 RepID=A0A098QW32_9SPIO|nr:30S ribosomal protein S12 methylthiotransferase RimO [Spirochaeta lutea]KGE71613.1 hypothetical protein DC28_10075 [Spirochaeta lutea]